jgi:hypothetical protein
VTIDNITETAAMLGVSRQTIHWCINKYPELQEWYINKYPELQEHRAAVTSAWKNPYFVKCSKEVVQRFSLARVMQFSALVACRGMTAIDVPTSAVTMIATSPMTTTVTALG